jgi:hypothetical protein
MEPKIPLDDLDASLDEVMAFFGISQQPYANTNGFATAPWLSAVADWALDHRPIALAARDDFGTGWRKISADLIAARGLPRKGVFLARLRARP